MQLTITLDGTEGADVATRVIAAVEALYNLTDTVSLRVGSNVDMAPHLREAAERIKAAPITAYIAADPIPDAATVGFGSSVPDPATVGFGSSVPSPAVGTTPPGFDPSKVEVDTDALPWDGRIHASTKTKNQDGRWKKKKGAQDALVEKVVSELRTLMAIPGPGSVHAGSALPSHETTAAVPPPPPAAAVPPPPPAATVPPPPATTAAEPMTFPKLMAWIGPRVQKIGGPEAVTGLMQTMGVVDGEGKGQLGLLAIRADLVQQAYDTLRTMAGE